MSDPFGELDPRAMPHYQFFGALDVKYDTAERAETANQNFTVCPRYWYVDATFGCVRCGNEFCFSASEQRHWYEELKFWINSLPKRCPDCRRELRNLKAARQEYDRNIASALQSDDLGLKARLIEVIDEVCETGEELPEKICENRRTLAAQIARDSP